MSKHPKNCEMVLNEQWNVMPLLGHFGGRVGTCSILKSPPLPLVYQSTTLPPSHHGWISIRGLREEIPFIKNCGLHLDKREKWALRSTM